MGYYRKLRDVTGKSWEITGIMGNHGKTTTGGNHIKLRGDYGKSTGDHGKFWKITGNDGNITGNSEKLRAIVGSHLGNTRGVGGGGGVTFL